MMKEKARARFSLVMVLLFVLSLVLPVFHPMQQVEAAEGPEPQTLGDLQIGDRVVDNSWEWEHKTGNNYTGVGETKSVTWIVVAKDHYSGGDAGSVAGAVEHVTLLSEEIIAKHAFDDSTDRNGIEEPEINWDSGSNRWDLSGTTDAEHGMRPFLNSMDKNDYAYAGEGFYNAFSSGFKKAVVTTTLPNKIWNGAYYSTVDKVFLPTHTELGFDTTPVLGDLFDFFADAVNEDRIANLGADPQLYYTRSPGWTNYYQVRIVMTTGGSATTHALYGTRGVRPAVNMLSDVRVAETEEEGLYEIIIPQPIGDLQIGDRVVDNSWEWEHKTGNNYTGFGETKPVTWIVVGKDHFDVEGVKSPVTLLSEDIIGRYKFDDSANRNDEDGQFWDRGSSHWGASGTPNAQYGQRPFLNDLFYSAFSEKFQNAILTTKVPNSTKFNNDWEWIVEGEWITYDTFDQVFILSTAELGDTANLEPVVGSRLPYFDGDEEVVNDRRALDTFYSTRTPLTNIEIRHIANNGNFSQGIADNQFRVRPALNISDDIIVSPTPNDDGAYVILSTMPDAGNSGITGMEKGIPGSKAVTLTITVENIAGEGFTGYTETDFSFSIEGADSIDFTDAAFSEFTDNDDGTYTVTFTGEEDDTAYIFTALTVSGVLIQDTAEITTPRPCPLTEGDGSKETPFLIYNAEQLNSMRYYPDKHFKLMDVIDLENAAQEGWDYDEEKGWEPVGPDDDNPFTGTLDGNGHTISNLFIDRSDPGEEHYGLFGYIDGATLKNVHLVNVNVTGEDSVGTLAGEAAPFSVINNCSATGNVSGNQRVGGLVGYNYGYITKSYASATVTGHGGGDSDTGGLVGWNKGDIINSYALGPVSSVNFVGGLVGYNGDGKIQNSYSSGTVEGDCCVGGLVGDSGSAMNSYYDTDACGLSDVRGIPKSTLAMKFEETFTGWDFDEIWAIGYEDNGTFYRTYPYLRGMDYEEYPGQEIPGSVSGMVTLDGEGDLTGSTVTLLDEDEDFLPLRVTVEEEDGTYIIEGIPIGTYNLVARNPGFEKGTVEDTEVVGGEDTDGINFELSAIANTGSISGTVTDVDTGDSIEDARVYLYYDGTLYEAFTGADGSYTLNSVPVTEPEGDGYTVTASATRFSTESEEGEGVKVGIGEEIELNFTLTRYFDEGLGTEAFPYIITDADHLNNARYYLNDHTVHFRVESDIDLNASPYKDGAGWEPIGTEEDPFNGTFDGNGHTISNLFIDRDGTDNVGLFGYAGLFASIKNTCLVDADITGWDYVGGLVGDNLGSVKDCSVTGEGSSVSGDCCVGGLVGDNKGSVTNSHATADVTSSCCYAGGLVGYNNGGHISNSYAGGEVSGCCEVGGLVGYNDNGYVNNCYATGTVTGNCCFGGLVGDNTGIVSNSYYNSETSGQDDDDRGTPKTTAQMKNPQIFTGWNFDTIWTINEGSTYPYLQWQTDNFDFAPPIFAEGYPQPGSRTYESIELLVKADEDATAYYVVLLEGMDAPDALQVRDGQDGNGEPAENGNFPLTAYTVASTRIEGLLQETDYDIYVVAEDTSGNLQPDDYMGIIKNVSTVKPPSAANSEITGWTKGNPGSRQVTIDILLKDDGEGALPGYIYTDFTVSVEGDAPVNFAGESFSGFTDNGDGTYSVIYIGEEDETSYTLTDLTVAEVIIHDTEEITTPRPCPLTEGDGSELNPFLIYNADQLNSMRYHLDKHFRIAADIDLEEYLAEEGPGHNEGAGWEPVGTEEEPFTGTLDGNGYSINNLFINRPLADYVGLFGYTDSSTINNVCLVEVDVSGRNNVGGLVGYNSGNINNSKVAGEVNCFWVAGGGMAGSNDGGSINHSYADVIVNGEVRAGGLVGLNNGEIIGSYALGVVESGCCEVGGLVGYNEGNIEDCYATGEVNGLWWVGSLVGDNSGEIKNSYAVGYVHGEDDVGGLMGRNTGDVFDSYYNSETTGQEDNDGRGTPITTEEMKDPDTFAEWDFDDIWEIATGTYPYLQWQTNNFDFAHPLFAEDYPRAENIFYDSFDLLAEVDEDATVYYVVLPVEADAPDALQVSSGKDADDKDADLSGSLRVEAAVETQLTISGLNPKTAYRIFAAVEDDAENLQSAVSTFEVTTLAQPDPANSSVSAIDPESPQIYASFTITAEVRDGENEPITGLSAGTFSLTGGAGSFTVDSIGEDGATGNYIVTARYDTLGTINISIHVMGIKVGEINNVVIQKSEQEAPASPVIESRTTTGITLEDMGGQVEYSRDSGATWQDSPVFEGLNINTEYSFVARLKETATHKLSPESEPVSGYTLAAVPGLTAVADGTDTIDLTVDLAGNPEGTEYEIQRSEDSDFNNIFTAMDWGENTVFSDIGVIQNTTYYYRVMARNGEGTETSWSETAEATTEQDEQDTHPAPADVTVPAEAVFGEEITVDWSAVAGTTGYIMQVSTDGGITWGADVAKGVATSHEYTIAGMEDHIFRVKAMRDGFTDSGWTLSDAVSINKANREAPDAPVIESRTTTSITLSDMGGDIGYSRDGGNTWQSERTFTDLSPGTEYTFVARFIGTDTHNPSDMSEGVSGFTSEITPGQGILIVTINPEGARVAGAQWSVDGGITWFDSGAEELTVGTYTVTFEDIPGWDTPDLITDVEVTEGDTDLVAEYTRHTGTLTVTIEPEGAVNAGAQWRLTTGTDTAWKDSGDTIGNIPTGEYTVEFEDVDGYNTPDELTVTIVKDEETTETATYTRHTGTLTVTIEPEDARIAEAQWRVEGDATWRDSGDVLTLDAGTYTIYFKPIGGWNTPSSIETEVTVGGDITETAEYEPLALGTGSLNVIITPRDAREAGAQWSVDGGTTWYDGGHSLNKNAGTYTITFKPIDGWDTPDPIEDIVLADGASITEEAEYTRHTGTLTVTIDPEDAVNAGAQWRLTTGPDTAWKDSGDTIGSIPIGEYTVVFKDAEGYNTPDELTVTIVKDVETTETATYILHTDEPIKYGDVNGQGSITVSDAILVLRHIVGLTELDDDALKRAKVNDGENLTVSDAILILRKIVGLIDGFPVEG